MFARLINDRQDHDEASKDYFYANASNSMSFGDLSRLGRIFERHLLFNSNSAGFHALDRSKKINFFFS